MRVFDVLFRRHFWVVELMLLLGVAFLAARVINNLLAVRIVALETSPVKRTGPALIKVGASHGSSWAELIAHRNLFNAHPPEPVAFEPGGVLEPEPRLMGTPPGPGEPCEPSASAISLMATMVAQPVAWSSAVVDDGGGRGRVLRRGHALGAHVLVAIHRTRIVLSSEASGFECVSVGPRRRPKAEPRARAQRRARPRSGGVKKVGAYGYVIDRAMLDEQLADLNQLAGDAGVVAQYRDGKPVGFKLLRVRAGSLFSQLGLRRGDVLKGVDDEVVTRPKQALALLEQLKSAEQVTVMLERRGRPVTLDYSIQ